MGWTYRLLLEVPCVWDERLWYTRGGPREIIDDILAERHAD
jgi:hypothetical protein